ncbi:phosphatidylserine decarboxylase 2 [Fusarium napiforme]|uniref:Phosphatidylserine decarboxylase 2 n=1 Tax=Fusarium napiforme TaxID=42672 RepID=A0A8H5JEG4_9HYPO|nr:phosphatidylserine decarboxylase 2 [Fusarium napiforme]
MPSGLPTAPDTEIGFQPPPPSKGPLDKIRKGLVGIIPLPELGEEPVIYNPIIIVLTGYLETIKPGALDEAVHSAYQQIPEFMDKLHISDARSFLDFSNDLLKWVPHENYEGKDIYDILCMFYFIIDQPPLANLQTSISPDQVGQPLTWLSSWIVVYAQLIGLFMDSPASLTKDSLESFSQKNSPKYNYDEALIPEGGFHTFNQFFSRHLKPGMRPITEPENDRVIVYPADCTYDNSVANQNIVNIESDGVIMIKNLPWTISSLLQGSDYADEFHGGVWMHAFLNTFNYHRQHAPVAGEVLEAKTSRALHTWRSTRNFLQTRGMIIIDNPVLGKVAVLPIVEKGQEISYFQFGGSDVICVFQPKSGLRVEDFVASSNNTYSKYGTILARAPQK